MSEPIDAEAALKQLLDEDAPDEADLELAHLRPEHREAVRKLRETLQRVTPETHVDQGEPVFSRASRRPLHPLLTA
jgi:hypothetical protein